MGSLEIPAAFKLGPGVRLPIQREVEAGLALTRRRMSRKDTENDSFPGRQPMYMEIDSYTADLLGFPWRSPLSSSQVFVSRATDSYENRNPIDRVERYAVKRKFRNVCSSKCRSPLLPTTVCVLETPWGLQSASGRSERKVREDGTTPSNHFCRDNQVG